INVLCVVPQRLGEGEEIVLEQPELELALGQPVLFPLYTSTVRSDDEAGSLLQVQPDQLLRMPPLHTVLRGGKRSGTRHVPVTLAARSTEIGTLELWCVAKEGGNRWRLEFNVRDIVKDDAEQRRRSPAHLSRWYHLVGYSLRPGFGDPLDKFRVEQLWKLVQTPRRSEPGQPGQRISEGGADYWIMWRRVAGGLNASLQQ